MKKKLQDSKALYWGLIVTFTMIYAFIGFVSTLHSIEFFKLANTVWLAIMLGVAYEVGQISVLFSILMTKGKNHFLPWLLMLLMTSLQISANVYASYKFMVQSGTTDWELWKKSLLFWLDASDPEMYRVVISWITGALLPIVALGLTALVAQNIQLKDNESEEVEEKLEEDLSEFEKQWEGTKETEQFIPVKPIRERYDPGSFTIDASTLFLTSNITPVEKKVKELPKGAKKAPVKKAPKPKQSQRETKKVLDELKKQSKGEELIEKITSGEIVIPSSIKENDTNQIPDEKDKIPTDDGIKTDGVEVIDVKVVPKDKKKP